MTFHASAIAAVSPPLAQTVASISAASWGLLLAGPALFLVSIVVASVTLSVRGVEPAQIEERVPQLLPQLLLGVLVALGLLFALLRPSALARIWSLPTANAVFPVVVGAIAGVTLAGAYFIALAPALGYLQRTFGDYVPPDSVLSTVSGNVPAFFLANVVAAPLVEETVYRGYAIPLLSAEFGVAGAVVISCLAFGLLHWPGGVWYVLLTGSVAGGLFAALFLWSGSVWAPFAAHLSLNLVEFLVAWRDRDERRRASPA